MIDRASIFFRVFSLTICVGPHPDLAVGRIRGDQVDAWRYLSGEDRSSMDWPFCRMMVSKVAWTSSWWGAG